MDLTTLYQSTGQPIPPTVAEENKLRAAAGDDWPLLQSHPELLPAFKRLLVDTATRERGKVPNTYTQACYCVECGPVFLWPDAPPRVVACPWCFNRVTGRPIPRPATPTLSTEKRSKPHV